MRTTSRRTRVLTAITAAGVALMAVIGPVAAAAPQPVTIVSHVTFNPDGPNFGDFEVTSGGGGLICDEGTLVDTRYVFGGGQSNRKLQILVLKDFQCPDGTFTVKIQVHIDFAVGETFTWAILGGTGAYGHLEGAGQGQTIPNADPNSGNTNIYTGFLIG
jgi:hypothetical protein